MNTLVATARRFTARNVALALLIVFAASVPLENVGQLGALGSAARIAGIAAAGAGVLALATDLPVRRAPATLFAFGAFVTWVAASYFWSEDPARTMARAGTFAQLLVLTWLIWQEARTPRACSMLMQAFVAGSAIACLDSIITRHPVHGGVPRFAVGDPNDFGVVIVIAMVMAYSLALGSLSRATRVVCLAFLPLGTVAVFLTASRTAAITLVLAAVVATLDRRNLRPRRLAVVGVLGIVMVVAVLHLVSAAQLDRIGSAGTETANGTLGQRTSQWVLSFETFSHHPLLGVGADAFRDVADRVTGHSAPAHNSFLGVLADLGIPGLLLFALVFASLGPRLMQLPRDLRRTWMMIALIWLLGASTLSWEHRKVTWFLAFLLLAQSAAWLQVAGTPNDAQDAARAGATVDRSPRARTPG